MGTSSLMLLIPGAPFHMMWIVVTDLEMTLHTAHHQPPPPPKNQIVLLRTKSLTVKKQGLVTLQMNTTAEDIGIAIRETQKENTLRVRMMSMEIQRCTT